MKTYWGVDPHFLDPCHFTPMERAPPTQWTRQPDWTIWNSWPYHDSNSDPSVVQPIDSRCTDCTTAWAWTRVNTNMFFKQFYSQFVLMLFSCIYSVHTVHLVVWELLQVEKHLPHRVIHYHQNEVKSVRIVPLLASQRGFAAIDISRWCNSDNYAIYLPNKFNVQINKHLLYNHSFILIILPNELEGLRTYFSYILV
jgi:hypothetical protein